MICLTSLLDLPRGCACRPKGLDKLVLASPFPPKFFANPRCPRSQQPLKQRLPRCIIARVFTWANRQGIVLDCALVHRSKSIVVLNLCRRARSHKAGLLKVPDGVEP